MISRQEAAVYSPLAQSFDRLDSDRDGALSREERRAGHRSGHHSHRAGLYSNGDGSISRDVAGAAPRLAEKFGAIDADKDGVLMTHELATWRKSHLRPSSAAPAEPVKPPFAGNRSRRNSEVQAVPAHTLCPARRSPPERPRVRRRSDPAGAVLGGMS